jgi:hypothetical protein
MEEGTPVDEESLSEFQYFLAAVVTPFFALSLKGLLRPEQLAAR